MELALVLSASILAAICYDALVGERPLAVHPVMMIGTCISLLEKRLNGGRPLRQVLGGIVLVVLLITAAALYPLAIRAVVCLGGGGIGVMLAAGALMTYCVKTSFAIRAMNGEAQAVARLVASGDLDGARAQVSYIVSRPTGHLDEEGVLSATVECVGESVVDGVVSPLFFAVVAGVYGCLGYRAVNTADSRIGYRTERYRNFGMPAARLDDMLNYLPARLAVAETVVAAMLPRMDVRRGVSVWLRDRNATESPNAGHTMALYAGLLGVRLAKEGHYELGDCTQRLSTVHVERACRLMNVTSVLHAALCSLAIAALPLPLMVI